MKNKVDNDDWIDCVPVSSKNESKEQFKRKKCEKCQGTNFYSGRYGQTACEECEDGYIYKRPKQSKQESVKDNKSIDGELIRILVKYQESCFECQERAVPRYSIDTCSKCKIMKETIQEINNENKKSTRSI